METYDFESKKLKTSLEKRIHITPNEVRSMIRDEVANWESYDEWFNLRIQSEKMERDRKKLDERRPKKPKNDAGDGPKNDAGDGPTTDAGDGPIDLTTTPKPFMEQPHFIRSTRSSTGYKGVVKDQRGGFRAKWSGKHIGRYETKAQACQAYYDYCMKHGYIGPR